MDGVIFVSQNATELEVENSERNNPEPSFIRTQNKTGRSLEAPQRKQKLWGPQEPQKKCTEHKSTTPPH